LIGESVEAAHHLFDWGSVVPPVQVQLNIMLVHPRIATFEVDATYDVNVACLELLQAGFDAEEHRLGIVTSVVALDCL
jgi:hypothetical protein